MYYPDKALTASESYNFSSTRIHHYFAQTCLPAAKVCNTSPS